VPPALGDPAWAGGWTGGTHRGPANPPMLGFCELWPRAGTGRVWRGCRSRTPVRSWCQGGGAPRSEVTEFPAPLPQRGKRRCGGLCRVAWSRAMAASSPPAGSLQDPSLRPRPAAESAVFPVPRSAGLCCRPHAKNCRCSAYSSLQRTNSV